MHKKRIAANFDIFDFSLSEADMKAIEPLNQQDTGFRDLATNTHNVIHRYIFVADGNDSP